MPLVFSCSRLLCCCLWHWQVLLTARHALWRAHRRDDVCQSCISAWRARRIAKQEEDMFCCPFISALMDCEVSGQSTALRGKACRTQLVTCGSAPLSHKHHERCLGNARVHLSASCSVPHMSAPCASEFTWCLVTPAVCACPRQAGAATLGGPIGFPAQIHSAPAEHRACCEHKSVYCVRTCEHSPEIAQNTPVAAKKTQYMCKLFAQLHAQTEQTSTPTSRGCAVAL
jgi:hypothetical protein